MATSRARLGALVNGVVYRHPAVLAKAAAQLDRMSEGRFEFSLGAGWAAKEFRTYGLEFPPLAERYERLDEAMLLVKLLWGQHRSTFHGRYYHLDDAPCEPKPVQWPHPPITVGGTGLGTLRVAAKHADRLNVIASPEKCAELITVLEAMRQEAGLNCDDIEFSVHTTLALARRSEDAEDYAGRVAASHGVELAELRDTWLIGDPAAVTARLRRYLDVGISHFIFALGSPVRSHTTTALPGKRCCLHCLDSLGTAGGDHLSSTRSRSGAANLIVLRRLAVALDSGSGLDGPRPSAPMSAGCRQPRLGRRSLAHPSFGSRVYWRRGAGERHRPGDAVTRRYGTTRVMTAKSGPSTRSIEVLSGRPALPEGRPAAGLAPAAVARNPRHRDRQGDGSGGQRGPASAQAANCHLAPLHLL